MKYKKTVFVVVLSAVIITLATFWFLERRTVRVIIAARAIETSIIHDSLSDLQQQGSVARLRVTSFTDMTEFESNAKKVFRGADVVILPTGYHFDRLAGTTLSELETSDSFPAAALDAVSRDNRQYGFPLAWMPRGLFYSRSAVGQADPPLIMQELRQILDSAHTNGLQPLILAGYHDGNLFDLFVSLYGNQPDSGIVEWFVSATGNTLSSGAVPEELPQQLSRAITDFQRLYSTRIATSSMDYSTDDVYQFLDRASAAAAFSDSSFTGRIPVDKRRSILFGAAPLQGPRRPIITGRLLAVGSTNAGAKKPGTEIVMQHLSSVQVQEELSSASSQTEDAFFPVHSRARARNEYARTAARMLAIASRVFPAELGWIPQPSRTKVNEAVNELLLP